MGKPEAETEESQKLLSELICCMQLSTTNGDSVSSLTSTCVSEHVHTHTPVYVSRSIDFILSQPSEVINIFLRVVCNWRKFMLASFLSVILI